MQQQGVGFYGCSFILFFCVLIIRGQSIHLTAFQIRRSTLYSWDGRHELGNIVETIDAEKQIHKVSVGTKTVRIPFVDDRRASGIISSSIWSSSLAGSILLECSQDLKTWIKDRDVIELGCGLGLGGFVTAAQDPARCQLTDMDERAIKRLQEFLNEQQQQEQEENNESYRRGVLEFDQMDWRDYSEEGRTRKKDKFDLCLGFDISYYYYLVRPIMDTVRAKLKDTNSLMLVMGQADRESQWQLYHNIMDGSYNQYTDEREAPWEGNSKNVLYKLQIGRWTEEEDETTDTNKRRSIQEVVPISALLYSTPGVTLPILSPHDHEATLKDEEGQMKRF